MTKNTPPDELQLLIERFKSNRDSYQSQAYNETQVRREFVDPLFNCMGWDVENKRGYAEAYKSVIHEDSLRIGGSVKAPDYSFRIGSERKFFVETKKPSVKIKTDLGPAYQLRRYGWSANLPLSILTDFEEFAVYDCRVRPKKSDKASVARILYFTFDEYIDRWDEIVSIFSEAAILDGSFDRFSVPEKNRRGTTEVDTEFLKELDTWRTLLAQEIATSNAGIEERELNYAVQMTIDRVIFLRIAEDRGIEKYGRLQEACSSSGIYSRMLKLFRDADDRYNSGLFNINSAGINSSNHDELTPTLNIADDAIESIVQKLYFPESPYEFSVISPDILGRVYEQFLGKVISLDTNGEARIEEKPEVRKAGGVYYTPPYVIQHILKNTVGTVITGGTANLVAGRTPKTWKKSKANRPLSILDPACGSGSFLIGAYQFMLDWFLEYYISDDPKAHGDKVVFRDDGQWYLTTSERKRILLDHIYGVDIDERAVEVTKLSLLLKVLEGESQVTLDKQMKLLKERALPDLGQNIKCGNSLIGTEGTFEFADVIATNSFDWSTEFPEVTADGGFDVVIGNPPYIDSEWMTRYLKDTRSYCSDHYQSASGNWDIFCVFIERAIDLCKDSGISSMIVPNKLGAADYAAAAREIVSRQNTLMSISDFSDVPVFPVAVYPIVYTVSKQPLDEENSNFTYRKMGDQGALEFEKKLPYEKYLHNPLEPWQLFGSLSNKDLLEKLQLLPRLGSFLSVLGAATVDEAYKFSEVMEDREAITDDDLLFVNSGTIDPFNILWGRKTCRYIKRGYKNPTITSNNINRISSNRLSQAKHPKAIVAGMTKNIECVADVNGEYLAGKSTTIISGNLDPRFIVGVLNSNLISFYYEAVFGATKLSGGYLRVGPPQLKKIPCPIPSRSNKVLYKKIILGSQKIMDLRNQIISTRVPNQRTQFERSIPAMIQSLNELVYEYYEITTSEKNVIENEVSRTEYNLR